MCGIAGIVRWKKQPDSDAEIQRMTAAVAHRGPDGVGFYRRDGVALGHRRLAIIDPELGVQPMADEDKTVWITYNGELYNFRELKAQLKSKGHRFVTDCDTEVVIHAYQEWGVDCVTKFRGMFAFAIADFRQRVLFLARDHFGIKPLHYRVGNEYLAFASELSALRKVDDAPPTGSLQAVDLYLRYNYIPTPHTIYHEVYKLPPASYMVIGFDGDRSGPVKYWDVQFRSKNGLSERDWEERAEETIRDSVKAHLVADVPFGVFLSGGIDSTLVAWQMSEILKTPVRAFAIGFNEQQYSELAYAEEAARGCGVELHSEIVRDDALQILPDLVAHYGEPFGDSSCIPTWYVSRLAREHVPMVLSGDGGDEAFGGYWSYVNWMNADPILEARQLMRSAIQSTRQLAPRAGFYWLRKSLKKSLQTFLKNGNELSEWQKLVLYIGEEHRRALWRPEFHNAMASSSEVFKNADVKARKWNRLAYAQYLDFQTYLPCDILTKVDVASMYHGLEVRTPLVDRGVVDLATSLPTLQRFRRDQSGKAVGKYLTKKVLGKVFPDEFIHRPKMGFGIPRAEWFYEGCSGRRLWDQVTVDESAPLYQFFKRDQVQALMDVHSPKHDNSGALWLLLVMGIWLGQNPEISFS
ncbi:MAG: asparagine synthase (glutamine-hydrolyzing) [Acidobacteria bacterium]|nr:MAG: asparagine synthase (glutamine-hydrolyzing) [Acidobacteriota bacterium]